ncbi:hypothetical protein COT97_03185 [Candidatus Falkowbacteria bacterium CG10_big_fil_rev_8_21_14_0_10_39_11]|uniref:Uncharacterized protein n=1 Tax=Candidatus Falkowbacteria bacterium CG10_big_fil_rev_8_21_14_0_10_39_11 TaxID=1974565 RepID=A0A2H0V4T0_9BACT|nr:MAG: hypothetical protein COT97_03185 [Candidatus Falkowbacteria bacterium CG10_big_fil_rev_8_21_14_0_10_39_11]
MDSPLNTHDDICTLLGPLVADVFGRLQEAQTNAGVNRVRIRVSTQLLASSWSEVLRWAAKKSEHCTLNDSMLPHELGRTEIPWKRNIKRTGLSLEQAEHILKLLGQEVFRTQREILLPWGGSVTMYGSTYVLNR